MRMRHAQYCARKMRPAVALMVSLSRTQAFYHHSGTHACPALSVRDHRDRHQNPPPPPCVTCRRRRSASLPALEASLCRLFTSATCVSCDCSHAAIRARQRDGFADGWPPTAVS
jgi:hypothetical protein